jgi:hypothetical protein
LSRKFPILVLFGTGETLYYRSDFKLNSEPSFVHKKYKVYLRPGINQLLLRISNHPRCVLGVYSSMKSSNVVPLTRKMFDCQDGLGHLWKRVKLFDELYCTPMDDHPKLAHLQIQ